MFDKVSNGPVSLITDVRSRDLILAVKRKRWWIILISLAAFAFAFWFSKRYFYYTSRLTVDVSPAPVFLTSPEGSRQSVDLFKNSEYAMRVLQFAHSNKMTDHLNRKFNLYAHYGINPNSKYAYEKLNMIINSLVQARKSVFDNVVITVSDGDRDFATDMADEVAAETDRLAREYFRRAMAGKLAYYEELVKNLNEDFGRKTDSIKACLREISMLKARGDAGGRLAEAESALLASSTNMDEIVENISNAKQSQLWIQNMMDNSQITFVTVMQKALPDQSNLLTSRLIVATFAFFAAALATVFLIFIGKTYRRHIQLFLSR